MEQTGDAQVAGGASAGVRQKVAATLSDAIRERRGTSGDIVITQFPNRLLGSAYFDTGGEPSWPTHDALRVIEWATNCDLAVFGGEVWLPTNPGPTIPMYAFSSEPHMDEKWNQFVQRANPAAEQFMKNFEWNENDLPCHGFIPYFNLTIDKEL